MKTPYFLVAVLFPFACEESNEKSCSSDLSTLYVESSTIFTGEVVTLGAAEICPSDQLVVTVNGQEVEITKDKFTNYSFIMPAIGEFVANIKLTAGSETATLDPIKVIKAAGTWKEVTSFPGDPRMNMVNFASASSGYLHGGERYVGFDLMRYNDLYKFDPDANSWEKVLSDDAFKQSSNAFADSKLFLPGKAYSLIVNNFSPISNIMLNEFDLTKGTRYFGGGGNVYAISSINGNVIEIQKYDAGSDTWAVAKEVSHTAQNGFSFSFCVEYKHKVYIGIHEATSLFTELWVFDTVSNSFSKVSSVRNDIQGNVRDLQFLFTVNDLGYFIESGEFSFDATLSAYVIQPGNKFYVYNYASNEWHFVQTEFPVPMYGAASMNVDGRGFAGMGTAGDAKAGITYSQRFFEFIPAR